MFCKFPAPETTQKSKGFPFELKNNHSATCYKHQPEEQPVGTMIMRTIRTSIYEPFSAKSTVVNHQSAIEILAICSFCSSLCLVTLPTRNLHMTACLGAGVRSPTLELRQGFALVDASTRGPPAIRGAVASWMLWRSVASCFGGSLSGL